MLDRFVAQRLVTADQDTVRISQEALLTAWPRLRGWLDTDRAGLVIGRQLAEAALSWHRENRNPTILYRRTRLAVAREWIETASPSVPLAREFLDTSTAPVRTPSTSPSVEPARGGRE